MTVGVPFWDQWSSKCLGYRLLPDTVKVAAAVKRDAAETIEARIPTSVAVWFGTSINQSRPPPAA